MKTSSIILTGLLIVGCGAKLMSAEQEKKQRSEE